MSLTTKRSIKLYDHLTSKQKASVSLGIYDADELQILAGTVERKTYSQLDDAFLGWGEYAFKFSTVLASDFWKNKATEYKLKYGIRGQYLVDDAERTDPHRVALEADLLRVVTEAVPKAQARQKAALEAMQALAESNGFLFADCLKLAGIEPEEVYRLANVEANAEYLDYLVSELRQAAPRV